MLTYYSEIRKIHKKDFSDQSRDWCQFFSDEALAIFMASFIRIDESNEQIRILDAGAGDGILAYAAVKHCINLGCKNIEVCLYELDKNLIKIIDNNLKILAIELSQSELQFSYKIYNRDFLASNQKLNANKFDIVIINPPFKKAHVYKKVTDTLLLHSNSYVNFINLCLAYLKPLGQLISITPRSFTSGAYFQNFRNKLLKEVSLEAIHLFSSRKKIFRTNSIYQENIICKFIKGKKQNSYLTLSCSIDIDFNKSFNSKKLPSKLLIKSFQLDKFIFVPENDSQIKSIKGDKKFKYSFSDLSLSIKTGPVVPFRTKDFLSKTKYRNQIPLLTLANIEMFNIKWSGKAQQDWFLSKSALNKVKLITKSYMVILRRFAPKDSSRRIIAAVLDPANFSSEFIGIENHLNIILGDTRELTKYEAYGLAAFLNSNFVDSYFRALCGSTQINKNELLTLRLPSMKQLSILGKKIIKRAEFDDTVINELMELI